MEITPKTIAQSFVDNYMGHDASKWIDKDERKDYINILIDGIETQESIEISKTIREKICKEINNIYQK